MRRIAYIDSWRAIAVTLVIVSHLPYNRVLADWFAQHHVRGIFGYGRLGVMIFFFISGFVVTKACLAEGDAFAARGFYIKRAFRIVPPLLVYLLACAVLGSIGWMAFDARDFLSAFLYTCNSSAPGVQCGWLVGHTWSLAFEEQFYLLFAWCFLLALGRRPPAGALAALLPIVLLPVVFPVAWIGWPVSVVTYGLFALGYVCARHEKTVLAWISPRAAPVFLVAAAACAFRPEFVAAATPLYQFVYLLAIPMLVLSSGQLTGIVAQALHARWLAYFGKISYSVYLWQQMVMSEPVTRLDPLVQVACFAAMIAGCAMSFRLLEAPLIATGRRIAAGKPNSQASGTGLSSSSGTMP